MTLPQQLLYRLLPSRWAESAEEESREWMITCSCGHQRSVWDAGGIRWKAAGNPKRYGTCSVCGTTGWMTIIRVGKAGSSRS